ncbi:hypothetical protein AJ80_05907 [Polytolypa hystricis UAMH7299]|uniref:Uncharacterized protein n=1 Tax=Polytolypa hystricis (strain UAMH7299) TaxID=1447883 RepID=A0A2B7Y0R9_POLH7|nr:hypothetical protein AJ80_05907 [Polytolypa hystricis UAMH7299]
MCGGKSVFDISHWIVLSGSGHYSPSTLRQSATAEPTTTRASPSVKESTGLTKPVETSQTSTTLATSSRPSSLSTSSTSSSSSSLPAIITIPIPPIIPSNPAPPSSTTAGAAPTKNPNDPFGGFGNEFDIIAASAESSGSKIGGRNPQIIAIGIFIIALIGLGFA